MDFVPCFMFFAIGFAMGFVFGDWFQSKRMAPAFVAWPYLFIFVLGFALGTLAGTNVAKEDSVNT